MPHVQLGSQNEITILLEEGKILGYYFSPKRDHFSINLCIEG